MAFGKAMPNDSSELSAIFAGKRGNDEALHRLLVPFLYDELRSLARRHLRRGRRSLQVETTELVHETFIRLASREIAVNDRGHFFSLSACTMRQILVDLARRSRAAKRGSGQPPGELEDRLLIACGEPELWLAVDEALENLKQIHPRLVQVVECRFFAGLTEPETAEALEVTVRTVQRDWQRARRWLRKFLATEDRFGGSE